MDWDNIRFFLAVVRSSSVSRAAEQLGVNQTTVSRRIAALERWLGKELFDHTGSGFVITPVAEWLVASVKSMAEEASTIERHVQADRHELSGELRVTVADVCTQYLAIPAIQAFTRQYPEVDLEIIATRDLLNLTARDADVALRSTDEPPPNLVGKRITELAYAVYGHRASWNVYWPIQTAAKHPASPGRVMVIHVRPGSRKAFRKPGMFTEALN